MTSDEDSASDGLVHVRGHSRGGPHGLVSVSEYNRSPPGGVGSAGTGGRVREKQGSAEFRYAIAKAEGSAEHPNHGYRQYNRAGGGVGALGRYQLRMSALIEAGWMDVLGRWTEKAGRFGIKTDNDFLNHPEAQEAALTDVLSDYDRQLTTRGLDQHVGREYSGADGRKVLITRAGLIAACRELSET